MSILRGIGASSGLSQQRLEGPVLVNFAPLVDPGFQLLDLGGLERLLLLGGMRSSRSRVSTRSNQGAGIGLACDNACGHLLLSSFMAWSREVRFSLPSARSWAMTLESKLGQEGLDVAGVVHGCGNDHRAQA